MKHLSTISQWLPLNVGFFAARDRLAMSFPKLRRRPTAFYLISQLVAGPVPFMVTSYPYWDRGRLRRPAAVACPLQPLLTAVLACARPLVLPLSLCYGALL